MAYGENTYDDQGHLKERINSVPNDKILDGSKFKAFADDKIKVLKMMISAFDRVEKIVGKGEFAVTSIFSFSLNVFKTPFTLKVVKSRDCVVKS